MRTRLEKEHRGWLWRFWSGHAEVAYVFFGLRGLRAQIEFPSDWHEERRVWVRLGFVLFSVNFSFPWFRVVPDQGQCSGPTYGFYYFQGALVLQWGKTTGRRGDPQKFVYMPWVWEHVRHDYLSPDGSLHHRAENHEFQSPTDSKQSFPYRYVLRDGTVQNRTATINGEEREWRWRALQWLPWPRKVCRSINIEFSEEVGERTGSWKGGTTGCGWDWRRGEAMVDALRRMERERKFT